MVFLRSDVNDATQDTLASLKYKHTNLTIFGVVTLRVNSDWVMVSIATL